VANGSTTGGASSAADMDERDERADDPEPTEASGAAGATPPGVEVSAKTVDEAVLRALQQLGCTREEVDVEVLHPGSPGRLLGFGAEPARIRVTRLGAGPAVVAGAEDEADYAEAPERAVEDEGEAEGDVAAETPAAPRDAARDAELARIMLLELVQRMGMRELRVDVVTIDPLLLNVYGGDVADLIGRRGENLRSLQFVLGLMLNKQLRRHTRVNVDADGYRARREELLTGMAERFAARVRSTGQPMQLEAMPPNERRIVHMALAEDPDVTTESVGEGDARRVVISPRS
jgi:spoIIIJ-associated protein